jgi:putative DNA primase/helicase
MSSALDTAVDVTFFRDVAAKHKIEESITLRDLAVRIKAASAPTKLALPWIKIARFGDKPSKKGSLRYDANMVSISGIEGDYDAGIMQPTEAAAALARNGIAALIYTTASHTAGLPKWRALAPLSRLINPSERNVLTARLNGALGGVLSGESFTLSQGYLYGSVGNNPAHNVWLVDGSYLDTIAGIPEIHPKPAKPVRLPMLPTGTPSTGVALAAVQAACARFAEPDAVGQVHQTMLAATWFLSPFVKSGHLAGDDVVASIVGAMPREPNDGEVESALARAVARADAYEPMTHGEEFANVPIPPVGKDDTVVLPVVLRPDEPLSIARHVIDSAYRLPECRTLQRHAGQFWHWNGRHYAAQSAESVRASLYRLLDRAKTQAKGGAIDPFKPTRSVVNDVMDALSAEAHLSDDIQAPAWIAAGGVDPSELIPCANGLLHIATRRLLAHTPAFFGNYALEFPYLPASAPPDTWLRFLSAVWPEDRESIAAVQELFGLILTGATKYQKIFFLVGPKRSGKGTIARTLTALIGANNVAAPTLSSLRTNFGLQPLIGKPLAIIGDARLGRRGDESDIVERLLSISGEDTLTVDRKFAAPWTGRLTTRLFMLSNETPRLTDASGALASRFIVLRTAESFLGREDHELEARLRPEMPGIFRWALDGLERLTARGRFIQPATGQADLDALEELASPIGAFVRDICTVGADESVTVDELYSEWLAWCHGNGQTHVQTKPMFAKDLHAAVPGCATAQPRASDGSRRRVFRGVGLAGTPGALTADPSLAALLSQ